MPRRMNPGATNNEAIRPCGWIPANARCWSSSFTATKVSASSSQRENSTTSLEKLDHASTCSDVYCWRPR